MSALLEVRRLTKTYKSFKAVNDVSFSIRQGQCFGLLGPNGAGKTTTIEMMEGIISPLSGEILYKGSPRNSAFFQEIGIQFQHTALLSFLTVKETLKTFQKLYNNVDDIDSLITICNLQDIQNQYHNRISGGQRQRLLLALSLVNRPELLFLDEPSTGLDPQARRNLWDIIQRIKSQGKTIVLTTHNMEEAQILCDEVAIMDKGQIIANGSVEELINRYCLDGVSGKLGEKANLENVFIKLTGRQLRE